MSYSNLLVLHVRFLEYSTKGEYYWNGIQFVNCHFLNNIIDSVILASGQKIFTCSVVLTLEFISCRFIGNRVLHHNHFINTVEGNVKIGLGFVDCMFYYNSNLQLIGFITEHSYYCSQASAISIEKTTFSLNNLSHYLINSSQATLDLYGPIHFTDIRSGQGIIALTIQSVVTKGFIKFHGFINISNNMAHRFLHFSGECNDQSIVITENTEVLIKGNFFIQAFSTCALGTTAVNEPHPLCFFQFQRSHFGHSNNFYSQKRCNYSVTFENAAVFLVLGDRQYARFTHCSWLPGSAFQDMIPKKIMQRFVTFKGNEIIPWNHEKGWCICFNNSHYNCKVDKIGPIFPGEKLVFSLNRLDHYGFFYNGYPGFYKRSMATSCKTPGILDAKLKFGQCTKLAVFIASNHSGWCELYIVNYVGQRNNGYDAEFFYVMFLPGCPVGFSKYTDMCQCDNVLEFVGVFSCNLNDRTILRPANSWITATTNNYSHNYTVSSI